MPLTSSCCCGDGPDPDPLSCCDCLASSYSMALDMGWTTDTDDTSGNVGSVDVEFSYSGHVVTALPCTSRGTDPPGQHKISTFENSSGLITGANVSLSFSGSPLTCVDRSVSGETLNSPNQYQLGFLCGNLFNSGFLACHHYRKDDDSVVYQWWHTMSFDTQTLCAGGLTTFFKGCVIAKATEQATCHEPPSSGWTVLEGKIYYCLDINGQNDRCSPGKYQTASTTNKTFTMTIT